MKVTEFNARAAKSKSSHSTSSKPTKRGGSLANKLKTAMRSNLLQNVVGFTQNDYTIAKIIGMWIHMEIDYYMALNTMVEK